LPHYGVAELTWNEQELALGAVGIRSLTAVLPDGVIVDVPSLCTLAPLHLTATGATHCSVYLHLLSDTTRAEGISIYEGDPKQVQRVISKAQISTQEAVENSLGTIKIGEFEKMVDSTWSVSRNYIPALLQVGPNPFLHAFIADLKNMLSGFRR